MIGVLPTLFMFYGDCVFWQLYEDLNKCMKKHGLKAGKRTSKIKARDKKIVSRGFHTAGRH